MSDFGSRMPLFMQDPSLAKATGAQQNPSFESFRPNIIHESQYKVQPDSRPSTHAMSVIRRNPDGTLDYLWAKDMVIDAVHNSQYPHALVPLQAALLTVVFPMRFRNMEPAQAEILTQFSPSEKQKVAQMVEAQLLEEANWNAGRGGGSVSGRTITLAGK